MTAPARLAYLDLMREIEDFLYLEADLLDERKYEEWLKLFTDDTVYWMPMRKNLAFEDRDRDITAENDVAWMHDDKATLEKRVKQIMTGIHWAEEPLSRYSHLITNIRIEGSADLKAEGSTALVKSRFLVHRNRLETETDFFYKEVDAQIKFVVDVRGTVTGLILFQNGQQVPAPKIK